MRIHEILTEEIKVPRTLYHATYRPLLRSIKRNGLGGHGSERKNWDGSVHGVVYLALDPHVAESYAETNDSVSDEWLDQIVILKISTAGLNIAQLHIDQNVQDNQGDTLEYHGVIPAANISMYKHNTDEDYDPNGPPPGPEFKPTMPAGTVRVDVSDVYDWYKLGQHISNLKGLGKHDFGKGPPSTIFSFGSEEEEHKYIKGLEKTGLTTTDIDPRDPKQPKGMKRQKVDPTFNVNETNTGQHRSRR